MANTYVDYNNVSASDITAGFIVTFPFLEEIHITVEVNGSLLALSNYSVSTTSGVTRVFPTAGVNATDNVRVRRKSQPDLNLVDFENGSVLTESELDRAYQHNRFLNEEISELNDASLQRVQGSLDFSAQNQNLKDLAEPEDAQDATTKNYVDAQGDEITDYINTRSLNDFDGSKVSGSVDINGNLLTGVSDPISASDSANKSYVDSAISGVTTGTSSPPSFSKFTGDGSETEFALTFTANVTASTAILVTIAGEVIDPEDYTIVGASNTIRFDTPPTNLAEILVIERGFKVAITDIPTDYDYGSIVGDPVTASFSYGGIV